MERATIAKIRRAAERSARQMGLDVRSPCYREGRTAYEAGKLITACPYQQGTKERSTWEFGWWKGLIAKYQSQPAASKKGTHRGQK